MGATKQHGKKQHFDNQIAATIENPGWSHNVRVGDESIDANTMTYKINKLKKKRSHTIPRRVTLNEKNIKTKESHTILRKNPKTK